MQTRILKQGCAAAAMLYLAAWATGAASAPPAPGADPNATDAGSDAPPAGWQLVIRQRLSPADGEGPGDIRWVVNTYRSSVDCQHALHRNVSGLHPEVMRRSRLDCVRG